MLPNKVQTTQNADQDQERSGPNNRSDDSHTHAITTRSITTATEAPDKKRVRICGSL